MIAVAAANAAAEKTAIGLRDIALLRVAFNALLRRSEIINLRRGDFIVADDGAAYLTAARAKTIDGGERNPLLLGAQTAKAISEWMAISAAAGITDNAAPLFAESKKAAKSPARNFRRTVCIAFRAADGWQMFTARFENRGRAISRRTQHGN